MKSAVLIMAHGAPRNDSEVEDYVLHVRHGRPLDAQSMNTIRERYRQIGGSPLLQWTERQAQALKERLRQRSLEFPVFIGMRHSQPFIAETVGRIISEGYTHLTAICMAPQFSAFTIGAYKKALDEAISAAGGSILLTYSIVRSYSRHPLLIKAFADRLAPLLNQHPDAVVIFTAHSLPQRALQEADPYDFEVKETARMVAGACRLPDWLFAYQSQGMTAEKWLGPAVEARLDQLAAAGRKKAIVAPIGFVCDHVEILYDIDILYREHAAAKNMQLFRPESLNDSSTYIELLSELVLSAIANQTLSAS